MGHDVDAALVHVEGGEEVTAQAVVVDDQRVGPAVGGAEEPVFGVPGQAGLVGDHVVDAHHQPEGVPAGEEPIGEPVEVVQVADVGSQPGDGPLPPPRPAGVGRGPGRHAGDRPTSRRTSGRSRRSCTKRQGDRSGAASRSITWTVISSSAPAVAEASGSSSGRANGQYQ